MKFNMQSVINSSFSERQDYRGEIFFKEKRSTNIFEFALVIVIFLQFFSAPCLATSDIDCSEMFLAETNIIDSKKLARLDLPIVGQKTPKIFFQSLSPEFENLLALSSKDYPVSVSLPAVINKLVNDQSLMAVLDVFKTMEEDTEYYFVGNGYYIPYLIAKTAFEGTALSGRIKFLAFSRKLAEESSLRENTAFRYFEHLELGKKKKRKIVVLDSLTSVTKSNRHSILRTSRAIRAYLISKGANLKEAIDRVVTMGMPERTLKTGQLSHRYGTLSLDSYFDALSSIDGSNYEIATFPYLDPQIPWDQPVFEGIYSFDGYSSYGALFYWNGKFSKFNSKGMPIGEINLMKLISDGKSQDIADVLLIRSERIGNYLSVIETIRSLKPSFEERIQSLVTQHRLGSL